MQQAQIINLPIVNEPRGNLTYVESSGLIPFDIERTFWIYDVPGGISRGSHAFKNNQEFIIALSGSFDVILDDSKTKHTYTLNRSYYGLYVPAATWRQMLNFSTNAVALVLSSLVYDESDYIRDYKVFKEFCKSLQKNIPDVNNSKEITIKNDQTKTRNTSIKECKIIDLPKVFFKEGNITPINKGKKIIPFDTKRVFYIYNIPGGESRGAHAHKQCDQLIIAVSGSFEVECNDGKNTKKFFLNQPYKGLYMPAGIWASQKNFSSGAVCLVLASTTYEEYDYFRNYNEFCNFKKK